MDPAQLDQLAARMIGIEATLARIEARISGIEVILMQAGETIESLRAHALPMLEVVQNNGLAGMLSLLSSQRKE